MFNSTEKKTPLTLLSPEPQATSFPFIFSFFNASYNYPAQTLSVTW